MPPRAPLNFFQLLHVAGRAYLSSTFVDIARRVRNLTSYTYSSINAIERLHLSALLSVPPVLVQQSINTQNDCLSKQIVTSERWRVMFRHSPGEERRGTRSHFESPLTSSNQSNLCSSSLLCSSSSSSSSNPNCIP
jgi:hypothetical protein